MTQVEKIANLMGLSYTISGDRVWLQYDTSKREYNPLTNKVDLMDVECALELAIDWYSHDIQVWKSEFIFDTQEYEKHTDKFTARAHAVCAVAEMIYDKGQA